MKRKRRAKKRKAIRLSRSRYSKALLRAIRAHGKKRFSMSRRRIAANPKWHPSPLARKMSLHELDTLRIAQDTLRHGSSRFGVMTKDQARKAVLRLTGRKSRLNRG